jgi:hypothetical protein
MAAISLLRNGRRGRRYAAPAGAYGANCKMFVAMQNVAIVSWPRSESQRTSVNHNESKPASLIVLVVLDLRLDGFRAEISYDRPHIFR